MSTLLNTLNLLGGLAIFLFGMKIMSDGLQKVSGEKMRQLLGIATTNRFAATACGAGLRPYVHGSCGGGGLFCQQGVENFSTARKSAPRGVDFCGKRVGCSRV